MEVKKFSEISETDLEKIVNKHFNHWSLYSRYMVLSETRDKFFNIYAVDDKIPYGIAMYDNDNMIGFCVFKEHCLEKYMEFTPWISDVMIFDDYRGMGYGRKLIENACLELKKRGYKKAYLWTDQAPLFYQNIGFAYVQDVLKNDDSGYGELYSIDL